MENYVGFFSGGKDGLYAVYLAQKYGKQVKYLLTLKTTIGVSPHYENISSIAKMAKNMKKEMKIFDMNFSKDLPKFINDLDVSGIINGDINLEEHLRWIENLAKDAHVKAFEPLWKRDSLSLVKEMINAGFVYSIIAVDRKKLSKSWLGYVFKNFDDVERFIRENPLIDPAEKVVNFIP